MSWFGILCLLIVLYVLTLCPFLSLLSFMLFPSVLFPLCVSLHYLTCPLPPHSPHLFLIPSLSVCVFSPCSPCSPCQFVFWHPPRRTLCFLLCPVWYIYYFGFMFFLCWFELCFSVALIICVICYFVFGPWMHFHLFSWGQLFKTFNLDQNDPDLEIPFCAIQDQVICLTFMMVFQSNMGLDHRNPYTQFSRLPNPD